MTQQQGQYTVKQIMLDQNRLKKRKEALERDLKIVDLQLERNWEIIEDTFVAETMDMGLAFENQMNAQKTETDIEIPKVEPPKDDEKK